LQNAYGDEWKAGDVITVLIDLDKKQIEFLCNGDRLGVAFEDIDTEHTWYPALSLASGQGCTAYFGSALDSLRFVI
jgi:hypothetical protein